MKTIVLLLGALPGLPDARLYSASGCEWLLVLMGLFMLVLLVLLGLAVFLQIRDYFVSGPGPFWRKVT